MLINSGSKINFGARALKFSNIENTLQKRNTQGDYKTTNVRFVDIEPFNKNDMKALHNIANYWIYAKYAPTIAYSALLKRENPEIFKDIRILALTSQDKDFKNLDDKKILGIVEVEKSENNVVLINYLQVNPEYVYTLEKPKFSRCGSKILDYLKSMYNNKTIALSSANANAFYEKNGFVLVDGTKNKYIWNKQIEQKNKLNKIL